MSSAIDEHAIDTASDLAIFLYAIDQSKVLSLSHDERMLSRHTSVIEDDVILFRTANGVPPRRVDIDFERASVWFSDR